MSKVVYLATTEGCLGCKIMQNILDKVYKANLYTFITKVVHFDELPNFIKVNVPLNDFPLLVFVEDGVIKYHIDGTITAEKLQEIITNLKFN